MAYDNTNRGAIFQNDRKTEDKHPDRTGSINVEGVDYFIDGWLKETKPDADGKTKKFLSLSVKRKNKQGTQQPPQERKQTQQRPPMRKPAPPARDPDLDPEYGDHDAPDQRF